MEKIVIKNIEDLKKLIKTINEDEAYHIELDDDQSFYAISEDDYDLLVSIKEFLDEEVRAEKGLPVKIVSNTTNDQLSFEQYETLKKQINEALEQTLKPKAEKLN